MNNLFSHVLNLKSLRGIPFGHISNLFLGICLLFIAACTLFKEKSFYQADSLLRQNTNQLIKNNSIFHSKAVHIYTSSDSADNQYITEIYPKGFFIYSPEKGFNGTAERVVLKGRVKEGKSMRDSVVFTQKSNLRLETKEAEREVIKTRSKEKEIKAKTTRFLFLPGFVMLVLVLLFVFRKFFRLIFWS